jgi:hypothetical protein
MHKKVGNREPNASPDAVCHVGFQVESVNGAGKLAVRDVKEQKPR